MNGRWAAWERTADGLFLDLVLYAGSAAFALFTAMGSTLAPHRAWGAVAVWSYAVTALVVVGQLVFRGRTATPAARGALVAGAWVATVLTPLVVQAVQRAAGRPDRAQEEVVVVEHGGQHLLDAGTPYLGRAALAALPPDERLLWYLPYQPGMALFGLPRAVFGAGWWTDARVWFALVTAAAVLAALALLRQSAAGARVRAAQAATVLPLCALTLAVGGDDLPVLALCLLALAFAARAGDAAQAGDAARGWLAAGLAVGAAGALKLFAWPVAVVLVVLAATRGRRPALACAAAALGLPVLALLPVLAVDPRALVENVVRFPLGRGLVTSPARSPFPGYLIATGVPGGRVIAATLLVLAVVGLAGWLLRRPPRDAAGAAAVCACGMAAAILLLPATRFGYLLYPAAYALWIQALPSRVLADRRTQGA